MKKKIIGFVAMLMVCVIVTTVYAGYCVTMNLLVDDRTAALNHYNYCASQEATALSTKNSALTAWQIADGELQVCEAAIAECDVEIQLYHNAGLCHNGTRCPSTPCQEFYAECTAKAGHIYDRDVDPDYTQAEEDAWDAYLDAAFAYNQAVSTTDLAENAYMLKAADCASHLGTCLDCD